MRTKLRALLLAAMFVGVMGTALPVNQASAATTKQIAVNCSSYTGGLPGTWIHISGINQNGTVVGMDAAFSSSVAIFPGWWWQGAPDGSTVNILVKKHESDPWMNRGPFSPSGGSSTYWNSITIVC